MRDGPRDDGFDACKVLERIDVLQAKMIGGDIHHDADIAMVKTEARHE